MSQRSDSSPLLGFVIVAVVLGRARDCSRDLVKEAFNALFPFGPVCRLGPVTVRMESPFGGFVHGVGHISSQR